MYIIHFIFGLFPEVVIIDMASLLTRLNLFTVSQLGPRHKIIPPRTVWQVLMNSDLNL